MRVLWPVALLMAGTVFAQDEGGAPPRAESRPIAVATNGVVSGGWTMDFDAAKAFAASHDLPLFLSFTGSDWCPHCNRVEREVFALTDWQEFASNRFVLVNVDLPRTPSAIPASVREKNEALQYTFEVQGFPTFVVLDADGRTVLKRFGLSKDLNATNFMREAVSAIRCRPAEVRRFVSSMGRKQAAAYTNLLQRLADVEKEGQAWLESKPERNAENMRKLQEFVSQNTAIHGALDDIEAEKVLADFSGSDSEMALVQWTTARRQTALLASLRGAQSNLENWLLGRPADTPANRRRLAELLKSVSDIQAMLAKPGER